MKPPILLTLILGFLLSSCSLAAPIATPTAEVTVIPTVASTPTTVPTPTEVPLASLSADQLVEKYLAEREIDTSTLSIRQRAAFSEALVEKLEAERGQQPIWVEAEDASGKVTLYHDVAKNKMERLPGSYLDNKEIIDQNSYRMFVAVSEEEGTGNLQYIHPDSGEKMILPDSAGIDWTRIIDDTNLHDGYMTLPTGKPLEIVEDNVSNLEYKSNFVQAILLQNQPIKLTALQGLYFDEKCLNMLFLRTDITGKPIYALRVFADVFGFIIFMKEGEPILERLITEPQYEERLKANQTYFVRIPIDQDWMWKNFMMSSINQLENTISTDKAYDAAITTIIPNDGNIILLTGQLIEKK
jgi:hypothetical protein